MMRYTDAFLHEIKARLRPSEVIGRTVQLRRAGREYVGLSPFTEERTPSFYVNDEKGSFFDFSSGKAGDLISFLQETERLSFREAVERLAAEAGVPLPVADPRDAERERQRQDLHGWMEEAALWLEAQLRRPQGEGARRYLDGRALPEEVRTRFRLGYAPAGRTALRDHLVAKGARPGELVEAGLLVAPEDGGQPFDRFRNRIIFPIADARGRIISFGGRALDPQARAKYLNGPESPLFHKGSTLYLLPEAKRLLHTPGEEDAPLVVVEGYMDAIACQRAGIAAVAPLGTALTEAQMAALWRLAPEPVLCLDGDAAGQRAAYRAIDRALPLLKPGRSFRFAQPSEGKDPDEVVREHGAAALKAQLAVSKPLVEALFEREHALAGALDTPERRAGLAAALRKLTTSISDPDVAQAYRDEFRLRLQALRPAPWSQGRHLNPLRAGGRLRRAAPPSGASPEGRAAARRLASAISPAAATAAVGLLTYPELADEHLDELEREGLGAGELDGFVAAVVQLRSNAAGLNAAAMREELTRRGLQPILNAINSAAAHADAPFLRPDLPYAEVRALWSRLYQLLLRKAALEAKAEVLKAKLPCDAEDLTALQRLKAERDALRREWASGSIWEGAQPRTQGRHSAGPS